MKDDSIFLYYINKINAALFVNLMLINVNPSELQADWPHGILCIIY